MQLTWAQVSLIVALATVATAAPQPASGSSSTNKATKSAATSSDSASNSAATTSDSATKSASNPSYTPPGQPIPQLLKDNPSLFYWPNVTAADGSATKNLPPSDDSGELNPLSKNWFGTGLFGYDECKKRGLNSAMIDDAYYDMWYLVNRDGIFENIDWNSAAALEFLAPPANNKDYQTHMQDMLGYAAATSSGWINAHYIHVRCDDPAGQCTKGCNPDGSPIESDTIAYTQQSDKDGYTSMNFCPRFFGMRRLRTAAIDYGKARPYPANSFASNYDNTARVFLHELLHADYFMGNTAENHVWDLTMNVQGVTDAIDVYGPTYTKIMAKFQPLPRPGDFPKAGYYVSRNADNMAWFATAKYVQDLTGTYPHLPIVYSKIDGPPWKNPGFWTSYTNGTDPTFDITSAPTNVTGAALAGCTDIESDAVNGTTGPSPPAALNITGMADDSLYPADYIANLTAWIKQDLTDNSTTPTTTTPPSSTATCVGNQVQGNCVADTLPSKPPFSGQQGPSCAKADGESGSEARLNATKAANGASQYCDSLISSKVVLSADSTTVKPAIFSGQAEGGKDMVLNVIYDQSSCPTNKANSTLDFAAFGRQACFDAFFTFMDIVCVQDSTWQDYNAEWTLEGGVYAENCGMFALGSQ